MSDHRSFPDAADGRPSLPMEPELWAAGLSLTDARFVARQLAQNGYVLIEAGALEAIRADNERYREAMTRAMDSLRRSPHQNTETIQTMTHLFLALETKGTQVVSGPLEDIYGVVSGEDAG